MPRKFYSRTVVETKDGNPLVTVSDGYTCREVWAGSLQERLSSAMRNVLNRKGVSFAGCTTTHGYSESYLQFWLMNQVTKMEIQIAVEDTITDSNAIAMVEGMAPLFPSVQIAFVRKPAAAQTSIFETSDRYARHVSFKSDHHFAAVNPAWWFAYLQRKIITIGDIGKWSTDLAGLVDYDCSDRDVYYDYDDHYDTTAYWKTVVEGKFMQPSDWLYCFSGPMNAREAKDHRKMREAVRQKVIQLCKSGERDLFKEIKTKFGAVQE